MNITNKDMITIAMSNDKFEQEYPGIALMLKPKLREFNNQNGVRIKTIFERAEEIDRRYHDLDESGQMVLKEGASKEDWEKESAVFLKEEVRLII